MTLRLLILTLTILLTCSNRVTVSFTPPDPSDINSIIETIIISDSALMQSSKAAHKKYEFDPDTSKTPICIDLNKVKISTKKERETGVYKINDLLLLHCNSVKFFKKSDSTFFLFQNTVTPAFTIKEAIADKFVITNFNELNLLKAKNRALTHFEFTLPIFSADKTKAYVLLTFKCSDCGYGDEIFLKKIDGKWVILERNNVWTS